MKIKTIYYSSNFQNQFLNLPETIREKIHEAESLFRENCFHQKLKTIHLQNFPGYWRFTPHTSYFLLFEFFPQPHTVAFIDISDNSLYT